MNEKQDFTTGSIPKKMIKFMFPILGALILQAMYSAVVTCILFSYMGYFNGHAKSLFVMLQGLAQSFLIRLPMSYIMSIRPNADLMGIGLAAPAATVFGIFLCTIYYFHMKKKL